MISLIKKPSAWIPILIPLLFFSYLVIYISTLGVVRHVDEGIGAHLFQLWIITEPFMLGFFIAKWWHYNPKQVSFILGLQILTALLPIFIVFYFNL